MNKDVLAQKEADVAELSKKISDSSSVVVVEYRGLTVAEITELRHALRNENVEMKVYKNTIAQRAVEQLGLDGLDAALKGPNALAFGHDQVAPARVLADFAKTHDKLILKSGIVDGAVVDEATINTLAGLPNKEGMLAKFASTLNAPVIKFALTIKALAEKKGQAGEAPAEEAAA
ncbi:MAG: 50S ribosomal protein L10 [Allobaculum sp.]|uniref:50S ribosomal protein L10 n=1 Tax=Allobaculum sp. TaxID=1872463 RepID=UPI003999D594